jgi:hypothetical protein
MRWRARTSPPARCWPRRAVDKQFAARRLSAALDMKIEPEIIDVVYDRGIVQLKNGRAFALAGGNAACVGDGIWVKNGKVWDIQPDEDVRPLPEASTKTTSHWESPALERYQRRRRPYSTP